MIGAPKNTSLARKVQELNERMNAGEGGAVPTKVSQLQDDIGIVTDQSSPAQLAMTAVQPDHLDQSLAELKDVARTGSFNDLKDRPNFVTQGQLQAIQLTPGPKGDPGKDGVNGTNGTNGKDGANGASPTISIGTVTTDTLAAATLVDGKLNLTLPKAKDGAPGAKGDPGPSGDTPTIKIGSVTAGATPSATLTSDGTLSLVLPTASFARYAKKHTTAADGTLTVTWPSGRFSAAPIVTAACLINDAGYVYRAQVLTCTATSATIKVTRSQVAQVTIVVGGLIKLNETLTAAVDVMVTAQASTD